ncbi:zinc finger BED domain-containing protein RICESLEEPER 2-like [Ipomoea triloba]|uniref:zinc finger BED domain-containing protein RICESLEEPER 2-like n=1 Tax=Ipomoea triloba TaxID=35885 RepID=UPI00125DD66C|nr:zinc finger BED domain-containing protein RICESLEEPER 2-like [Ipomoea triloba]
MPSDPKNTEIGTGPSRVTNEPNACIEEGGGKKRKRMEDRSDVWKHYAKFIDKGSGKQRATCNYCKKDYATETKKHETSNLWNHLKDYKSYNIDSTQTHFFPIKHMLNGETEKGDIRDMKTWKFDNEVARKGLAHMIVIDELPFCFVEKDGFRTYIDLITPPRYQLPSRRTATKDIFELYIELRYKLFCVTVDNATSNDNVIKSLKNVLKNLGTNIMNGDLLHMRCFAHIINLVVSEGLKEVNDSINAVRAAVKYVRQSPTRLKKFKDCAVFAKVECTKALCLDVRTRWNSVYLMLDVAEKYERVFERYEIEDPNYIKELTSGVSQYEDEASSRTPNEKDWEVVRRMINQWRDSTDIDLALMAIGMKSKFDKYLGDPEKMNKVIFLAAMVDSTQKLSYVNEYEARSSIQVLATNKSAPIVVDFHISSVQDDQNDMSDFIQWHANESGSPSNKIELDKYLDEALEPLSDKFDILAWWKVNEPRFPTLSQMARDLLRVPISTVASESTFSTSGRILDAFRSSLTPRMVQAVICAQDWLRSQSKDVSVEEDIAILEEMEKELPTGATYIVPSMLPSIHIMKKSSVKCRTADGCWLAELLMIVDC